MTITINSDARWRRLKRWLTWLRARSEVMAPALGVPLFFMMIGSNEGHLTTGQIGLVYGLAVGYAALVIWSPMTLPAKPPQPFARVAWRRAALVVVPVVSRLQKVL
jgi:hypothetical protein